MSPFLGAFLPSSASRDVFRLRDLNCMRAANYDWVEWAEFKLLAGMSDGPLDQSHAATPSTSSRIADFALRRPSEMAKAALSTDLLYETPFFYSCTGSYGDVGSSLFSICAAPLPIREAGKKAHLPFPYESTHALFTLTVCVECVCMLASYASVRLVCTYSQVDGISGVGEAPLPPRRPDADFQAVHAWSAVLSRKVARATPPSLLCVQ